jgi:iron(III) transport system substrate-binding protein
MWARIVLGIASGILLLAAGCTRSEPGAALAGGPSAQIPMLRSASAPARVETPKTVHAIDVDWEAAARVWDKVAAFLADEFAGG